MRQSGHLSRCRLISPSTGEDSRPSKYQQIKWIVSLQLMPSDPLCHPKRQSDRASTVCICRSKGPKPPIMPITPMQSGHYRIPCPLLYVNNLTFPLKKLHRRRLKCAEFRRESEVYRCGMIVMFRRAAMRSGKAGCVLNRAASPPRPKRGRTMQSDEVEGEMAVVGMRLL